MLYQLSYPRAAPILAASHAMGDFVPDGASSSGGRRLYLHYTDGRSAVSALWGTAVKRTGGSVLGPK